MFKLHKLTAIASVATLAVGVTIAGISMLNVNADSGTPANNICIKAKNVVHGQVGRSGNCDFTSNLPEPEACDVASITARIEAFDDALETAMEDETLHAQLLAGADGILKPLSTPLVAEVQNAQLSSFTINFDKESALTNVCDFEDEVVAIDSLSLDIEFTSDLLQGGSFTIGTLRSNVSGPIDSLTSIVTHNGSSLLDPMSNAATDSLNGSSFHYTLADDVRYAIYNEL